MHICWRSSLAVGRRFCAIVSKCVIVALLLFSAFEGEKWGQEVDD
jgi:hypothetical protein